MRGPDFIVHSVKEPHLGEYIGVDGSGAHKCKRGIEREGEKSTMQIVSLEESALADARGGARVPLSKV